MVVQMYCYYNECIQAHRWVLWSQRWMEDQVCCKAEVCLGNQEDELGV